MQQERICFARVFDVVRVKVRPFLSRGGDTHTVFGFETASGHKHYNVRVPGLPTVESGMVVTAILSKKDDWHSILGWVNEGTGEMAMPRHTARLGPSLTVAAGVSIVVVSVASNVEHAWLSLALGSAVAAAGIFGIRQATAARARLDELFEHWKASRSSAAENVL